LKKHAEEKGLIFLSSPFSNEAVEMLSRSGIPAWKIASGEMNNSPCRDINRDGKPILVSTGMSKSKKSIRL
jgi:N-acetylneuraminate synthase